MFRSANKALDLPTKRTCCKRLPNVQSCGSRTTCTGYVSVIFRKASKVGFTYLDTIVGFGGKYSNVRIHLPARPSRHNEASLKLHE